MEEKGINPQGLALLAAAAFYLTRRPGVLSGFFDTYFQAPMQARAAKVYCKVRLHVRTHISAYTWGGEGR